MKLDSVRVRLTELEKKLLKQRAESLGLSQSDFIKYCCLQNPPKELELKKLEEEKK